MALKPLQPGAAPIGQFDGLDAQYLNILGGEVVTFAGIVKGAATDKSAYDANDGYVPFATNKRAVVTNTLSSGNRPLFLADEGVLHYGTVFGQICGSIAGSVTSGAQIGPSTATGSGKVTCWTGPGLFAVSLDAVDTTASTGLVPTNPTLTCGAALYATTAGLLTPNSGASFEATLPIGRFVEFQSNGSLVTTPNSLIASLTASQTYGWATFYFNPPTT